MKSVTILAGLAAMMLASPATAGHLANLTTPYETRGACEAAMATFSEDDRDFLLTLPNFFSTEGDAASFLTRAFRCELNASDDQWYITDHRIEVLTSDWYQRRRD